MIRVLLLLGLVTGEALAQVASATLSGIVFDESADTVIPGFYNSAGAQDENDLRLERAISSVVRNWQLMGTVTLQDGVPANVLFYAFASANTGFPEPAQCRAGSQPDAAAASARPRNSSTRLRLPWRRAAHLALRNATS